MFIWSQIPSTFHNTSVDVLCLLSIIMLIILLAMFLCWWNRNPLYLMLLFVAYLLSKAMWVQMDVGGQFQHGTVRKRVRSIFAKFASCFDVWFTVQNVNFAHGMCSFKILFTHFSLQLRAWEVSYSCNVESKLVLKRFTVGLCPKYFMFSFVLLKFYNSKARLVLLIWEAKIIRN